MSIIISKSTVLMSKEDLASLLLGVQRVAQPNTEESVPPRQFWDKVAGDKEYLETLIEVGKTSPTSQQ